MARVAYDGTAYAGFQIQPNAPTVQGELERVLAVICGEPVRITNVDHVLRSYECRCARHLENAFTLLSGTPSDLAATYNHAWACAGHPEFRPPAMLDGAFVTAADDWLVAHKMIEADISMALAVYVAAPDIHLAAQGCSVANLQFRS
jgi:hypothetical protein